MRAQIIALVPSAISPNNNVYYATIVVTNNGVASNPVTVYTSNTAPGVFANPVAVGAAAAQHGNYSLITDANPAAINETIIIYTGGLGAVNPPIVPDGGPAIGSPYNLVTDLNVSVDFGYVFSTDLPFIGATPTTSGLYQIDAVVPAGYSFRSEFSGCGNNGRLHVDDNNQRSWRDNRRGESAVSKKRLQARNRTRAKKTRFEIAGNPAAIQHQR